MEEKIIEELSRINQRIETIEKNLNGKMDSLLDLLRDIITTNLRNTNANCNKGAEAEEGKKASKMISKQLRRTEDSSL